MHVAQQVRACRIGEHPWVSCCPSHLACAVHPLVSSCHLMGLYLTDLWDQVPYFPFPRWIWISASWLKEHWSKSSRDRETEIARAWNRLLVQTEHFEQQERGKQQGLLEHACFFSVRRLAPLVLELLAVTKLLKDLVWKSQSLRLFTNKMEYSPIVFLPYSDSTVSLLPGILHTELKRSKTISQI